MTIVLNKEEAAAVEKWLSEMSEVDRAEATASALKAGMQTIQQEGKSNLAQRNKVRKGNLKKSFSIRVYKKKGYSLGGFRRPAGAAAHLVDRGTVERWTKKGRYTGSVSKGRPKTGSRFYTDAVESQGPNAVRRLIDAVFNELERITQRNKK